MGKKRKITTTDTADKLKISKEEIAQRRAEEKALDNFEKIQADPPHWLSYIAKNEWKRIIPLLKDLPIASLDLTMVASYCQLYGHMRQLNDELKNNNQVIVKENDDGTKSRRLNPAFNAYMKVQAELRAVCNTLGLTVDSRLKMVVPEKDDEEDEIMKVLKGEE